MLFTKLKTLVAVVVAVSMTAYGGGLLVHRTAGAFAADEAEDGTILAKATSRSQIPGADKVPANHLKADRILIWKEGGLASIRPNGEDFKWVTEKGVKKGITFYPFPRLSPNGQFVAYRINGKDEGGNETFKYLVKGLDEPGQGREIDVVDKGGIYGWSPDGNKMFFSMAESITPQRFSHWLLDVRTMKKTALKIPEDHVIWDWSPDGKWFLTTCTETKTNGESSGKPLHLVKIDGSEVTEIGYPNQNVQAGLFSPDGKKILFNTRYQLHVLNLASGKLGPVTLQIVSQIIGFCWSADGKRIAYCTQERREHDIITIDEEGRDAKTIMTGEELFLLDWR